MTVAGRSHGDARGEVEKFVAVHVSNDDTASALGYQRVGSGVRRRNVFVIARQHALGVGAGQGGLDLRSGSKSLSRHGILLMAVVGRWLLVVSEGGRLAPPQNASRSK